MCVLDKFSHRFFRLDIQNFVIIRTLVMFVAFLLTFVDVELPHAILLASGASEDTLPVVPHGEPGLVQAYFVPSVAQLS
jgi:hypothetical protein